MAVKWDVHHTLILVGSTVGGAVLGYFESQQPADIISAFRAWHTFQPLLIGAVYAGLAALLALAKQTFLVAPTPPAALRAPFPQPLIQERPTTPPPAAKRMADPYRTPAVLDRSVLRPIAAPARARLLPVPGRGRSFLLALAVTMAMVLVSFGNAGCSFLQSPQGQQSVTSAIDVTVCVLNHSSEPVQQILTDCGPVAAQDVIKILDAHRAATVRELAATDGGAK